MKPELWRTIKEEITVWRVGTLILGKMDGNIYGFWLGVWLELPLLGSLNHL